MSDDSVLTKKLADLLNEILCGAEVDPANPNARLVEDYGANSMDIVDIAERIERQFKIIVPNDQIPKLRTLEDIVAYVRSQLPT